MGNNCDSSEEDFEKEFKRARASQDSLRYAQLHCEHGFHIDDENLYQMGLAEMVLAQRNSIPRGSDSLLEHVSGEYWGVLADITLRRFPGSGRVLAKELRIVLSEAKKAGYPVGEVFKLDKNELWQKLRAVRSDVARQARKHCPDVLSRINRRNYRQREDEYNIR